MRAHCRANAVWAIVLVLGGLVAARQAVALSSAVVPEEESAVTLRSMVADEDDEVSGIVTNTARVPVRDVRLLVRRNWLWTNEFHPGSHSPGRACYVTIPEEIAPGGTARFEISACPAWPGAGGRFQTSVEVAGFTEVLPSYAQR